MRIYLDESKRLGEGKIVFGGFFSKNSHKTIEKFLKNKKEEYGIKVTLELKGTGNIGKLFYKKMFFDNNFSIIQNSIIGINIKNYNDNLEKYKESILLLLKQNYNYLKNYDKTIVITADYVRFGKKTSKIEKSIELYLNTNLGIQSKIIFAFGNSKNILGIQLADIISYKLGKSFFFQEKLDNLILENLFNIDIYKEFEV